MRVRYSPTALRQLDSIFSYVARDSAAAAGSLVDRIEQSVSALEEHPYMGRRTNRQRVFLLVVEANYHVVYRVMAAQDEVRILRIRDARRRPLRS
jgi:toxin ParE1/3/4